MKHIIINSIVLMLLFSCFSIFSIADDHGTNNEIKELPYLKNVDKRGTGKIAFNLQAFLNKDETSSIMMNANSRNVEIINDKIRVEVILKHEDYLSSLKEFNTEIIFENYYQSLAQILIPRNLIESLSEKEYIQYIRTPIKPRMYYDITSEGVGVIKANLVQNEGINGEGVKVAVIDGGFQDYNSNPELPASRIKGVQSFRADNDIEAGITHGCACAEIILDVAPMCDLYLYNFETISELNDAVDHAISIGIDIISFSAGYIGINDYDGIGYDIMGNVCSIVDNARDNDILFVVSAGNEAEHHYNGYFHDGDGDNWHEFDPPYETIVMEYVNAGEIVDITLTWDDWPYSNQDFDLYLIDSYDNIVAKSENIQSGSQPPYENIYAQSIYGGDYQIAIRKYSASRNVHFELYGRDHDFLTSNVPQSSLSCPSDAFGSTTTGASYWPDDSLESFSSRGPTNDGRIKPDLSAPDGVSTYAYGDENFFGTSASAPHTAGAAALLLSNGPLCTADDLDNILENNALDLGESGKDNSYGSGRINVWTAYQSMQPSANFNYSPVNPTTQDLIQFTDTSTDPDGTILSWNWNFGDGNSSTNHHPIHQYADNGTYTITLNITDNHGVTNDTIQQIAVSNSLPTVNFTFVPATPNTTDVVQFTDTSTDPDGTILSWNWNFGDGNSSTNHHPTHQYADNGTYTVMLTVTDDDGETNMTSKQVIVNNMPPVANFTFHPLSPNTKDNIQFTDNSYDADGFIDSWLWDFDDGNTSSVQHPTHRYKQNGSYNVTLTVTDEDGDHNNLTKSINVTQAPPKLFNLSGDIYYEGGLTGMTGVLVWDTIPGNNTDPKYGYWMESSGMYNFSLSNGTYYLAAFMDTNGDYNYSHYEPVGFAINKTISDDMDSIVIDGYNITGINITLFERNIVFNQNKHTYHYSIQQAIDNATSNDTLCVRPGWYQENIIVNKSLNITGSGMNQSWLYGQNEIVMEITADHVNISGFGIANASKPNPRCWWYAAVLINSSNYVNILNCNITSNNANGINVNNSNYCNINNTVFSRNHGGILLYDSFLSTITNTTIDTQWNNGLSIYSPQVSGYKHIIENTQINGNAMLYYYNISDILLSAMNCSHVTVANANNITITNSTIAHSDGIHFAFVTNSTVKKCDIFRNHQTGILLHNCSKNMITKNDIFNNSYGLDIASHSTDNSIINNTIKDNYKLGIGMSMGGFNNSIIQNHLENNSDGIALVYAASMKDSGTNQFNFIAENYITSNRKSGIRLYDSQYNTIQNNTVINNSYYGIELNASDHNLIFNNIFNNTNNAWDNGENIWNVSKTSGTNIINGPFLGGNNWSDYNGIDQNLDGFGDAPYSIAGGNSEDSYPLIHSEYDVENPQVNITYPTDDATLYERNISLKGNITDDNGVSFIRIHQTIPSNNDDDSNGNSSGSYPPINIDPSVENYSLNFSVSLFEGNNSFLVTAQDIAGNTANQTITIEYIPDYPPEIHNVSTNPIMVEQNEFVNISFEVTDDFMVQKCQLIITGPNGYNHTNSTSGAGFHHFNQSYHTSGTYSFVIVVEDNRHHENESNVFHFWVCENITTWQINTTGDQFIRWHDINLSTNFSNTTNISFAEYAENPHPEHSPTNALQKYIDITIENQTECIHWPMNITMFYSEEDLNISDISENQLLGLYYWNKTLGKWMLYENTGINTSFNQNGYEGFIWANVYHLTPLVPGGDSQPPSQVTGLTVSDAKDGKLTMNWNEASDNVAIDFYRVYRDGTRIDTTVTTVYTDKGLKDGQTYSYQISAVDTSGNEGPLSTLKSGKPTESEEENNIPTSDFGEGFVSPDQTNVPPVADLSVGEPYTGFVNEQIMFDGSASTDRDGNITEWFWTFDDGTNSTGEIVTHTFADPKNYLVTLKVTDNDGATDHCETTVVIRQPNNPPNIPTIIGPREGPVEKKYWYSLVSSDEDNDTIRYIVTWGDGLTNTTDYVTDNTTVNLSHSWSTSGVYEMEVYTEDDQNATSQSTSFLVMIDVIVEFIDDGIEGYLLDNNMDGVFDLFHNNETSTDTSLKKQDDKRYLIDSNNDGTWEYEYSTSSGLVEFQETTGDAKKDINGFPWIFIIIAIFSIIIIIFIILVKTGIIYIDREE